MNKRVEELVEALARDPWVDEATRRCCKALLKRWMAEDEKAKHNAP